MATGGSESTPSHNGDAATRDPMATLCARVDALTAQIAVTKELESLKRQITQFKTLATVVALIAATFGIKSFLDVRRTIDDTLKKTADDTANYYSDLLTGYAHMSSQNYYAAIPVLEGCFQNRRQLGKHYDPSVIAPLLMAYNEVDDWESAEKTIEVLEQNDAALNGLRDAWVYLNIGSIRVQEALDDPNKLTTGMYWLKQAVQFVPPGDTEMRRDISLALWMASLTQRDLQSSRRYIAQAMVNSNPPAWLSSWEQLNESRFFRQLFTKFPELQTPVRAMWTLQMQRRPPLSAVSLDKELRPIH